VISNHHKFALNSNQVVPVATPAEAAESAPLSSGILIMAFGDSVRISIQVLEPKVDCSPMKNLRNTLQKLTRKRFIWQSLARSCAGSSSCTDAWKVQVYDVSTGAAYQETGGYAFFTGKDGSAAFVTGACAVSLRARAINDRKRQV
jgi:hypothetical protein